MGDAPQKLRPFQFGLGTLLSLMVACALLFGAMRWMEVSPTGAVVVLVVLFLGAMAALGLVVAITRWTSAEDGDDRDL